MRFLFIGGLVLGALLYPLSPATAAGATAVDAAARHEVIERLSAELSDRYVFPDRALTAVQNLAAAEKSGAFDALSDPEAFAKAVSAKLAETLHDKHLRLMYWSQILPPDMRPGELTPAQRAEMHKQIAYGNFGLAKAIRLRGNIGYLDVRGFPPPDMMAPALGAAMQFLSNTDALIIDLRQNGGGSPGGVALLCSYLFAPGEKIHINDIFTRTAKTTSGKTEEYWTTAVSGTPYSGKNVYVLTSGRTFSGGEEFAYDVQTQKRGTLVGEVTGGGANPGDGVRLTDHFDAFIPTGRAINPITHTNWEGVGVKPDVATTKEEALPTAYLAILRARRDAEKDPEQKKALGDLIDEMTKNPGSILLQ